MGEASSNSVREVAVGCSVGQPTGSGGGIGRMVGSGVVRGSGAPFGGIGIRARSSACGAAYGLTA